MKTRRTRYLISLLSTMTLLINLAPSNAGTINQGSTKSTRVLSVLGYEQYSAAPGTLQISDGSLAGYAHYKTCDSFPNGVYSVSGFLGDGCAQVGSQMTANQTLDFCENQIDVACIKGFWVMNSAGSWEPYSDSKKILGALDPNSFAAHPELHLGAASQGLSVGFPTFNYTNANRVSLLVSRYRDLVNPNATSNNSFQVVIKPLFISSTSDASSAPTGSTPAFPTYPGNDTANLWSVPSSDTPTFKIELLLPGLPDSWANGRIRNINISKQEVAANSSQQKWDVQIEGQSMLTPALNHIYQATSPSDYGTWEKISQLTGAGWADCDCYVSTYITNNDVTEYGNILSIDPSFNYATGINSIFSFESGHFATPGYDSNPEPCLKSPLSAFVTANSLLYSDFPTFDSSNSELSYQVASPHYLSDQSIFTGQYQLVMSKVDAQCLWRLQPGDFTANIQVTSSDGATKVYTSSMTQDAANVNFEAAGFTFSSPRISVKLIQKGVNPTPTITIVKPTPKGTIVCIKGKVKKSVSGVKCPSGYKRA